MSFDDPLPGQQEEDIHEGLQVARYRVNRQGRSELVTGPGWQPVNVVNRQAWKCIDEMVAQARRQVLAGKKSCLYYYMVANQMNPGLLAACTGLSSWRVRLHLRPYFFARLSLDLLQIYSELFNVSVSDLQGSVLRPLAFVPDRPEADER